MDQEVPAGRRTSRSIQSQAITAVDFRIQLAGTPAIGQHAAVEDPQKRQAFQLAPTPVALILQLRETGAVVRACPSQAGVEAPRADTFRSRRAVPRFDLREIGKSRARSRPVTSRPFLAPGHSSSHCSPLPGAVGESRRPPPAEGGRSPRPGSGRSVLSAPAGNVRSRPPAPGTGTRKPGGHKPPRHRPGRKGQPIDLDFLAGLELALETALDLETADLLFIRGNGDDDTFGLVSQLTLRQGMDHGSSLAVEGLPLPQPGQSASDASAVLEVCFCVSLAAEPPGLSRRGGRRVTPAAGQRGLTGFCLKPVIRIVGGIEGGCKAGVTTGSLTGRRSAYHANTAVVDLSVPFTQRGLFHGASDVDPAQDAHDHPDQAAHRQPLGGSSGGRFVRHLQPGHRRGDRQGCRRRPRRRGPGRQGGAAGPGSRPVEHDGRGRPRPTDVPPGRPDRDQQPGNWPPSNRSTAARPSATRSATCRPWWYLRYYAGWADKIDGQTVPVGGNFLLLHAPPSRSAWSARSSRGTSRC